MIIGFGLTGALLWASDFTSSRQLGLLYIVDMPLWAQVILSVLLLDLIGAYTVHWTEHKVKWMWKFHLVHHSDTYVEVTTGLKHHPGETVFRISFTILAVLILGALMGTIMLYQSLSVLFAHLTHANINVPRKVDQALSLFFVTPNMHKAHHHYQQPLTDTNYSNIFLVWDRLFGTFAYVEKAENLTYGVDTHMKVEDHDRLGNLLAILFQPYRPTPEGPLPLRSRSIKSAEVLKQPLSAGNS